MQTGLRGNLLPESAADYENMTPAQRRSSHCGVCKAAFSAENTKTAAGWRETQISGFCETCFDDLFKEE